MRNRTGNPSKNGSSIGGHGDSKLQPHPHPHPHRRRPPPKTTKKDRVLQDWDDDLAHLVESSIVTPRTVRATMILAVAMAVALLYNRWENDALNVDLTTSRFLADFCQETDASCHPRIQPHRRSQRTVAPVQRGETIVTIPRRFIALDVDALQDPYIQQQWAGNMATKLGHERIDAAAFLAVHLARRLKARRHFNLTKEGSQTTNEDNEFTPPSSPTLLDRYLDVLASADVDRHPLALNASFVERHLLHTSSLDVWRKHSAALWREYEMLAERAASNDFVASLSWEEYRAARLLVLTRAFGTGPPPNTLRSSTAEAHEGDVRHRHLGPSNTLRTLESQFHVDLSAGSYAMVPVLDFYDHHAAPNVGFEFKFRAGTAAHRHDQHHHFHGDSDDDDGTLYGDGSFHITALEAIAPHTTLHDSYGLRTDSDLFARYGFVQGDGTDYTQASLAVHPLDFRPFSRRPKDLVVQQRGQILRYLQYDDGYLECVKPADNSEAYELKRLKYEYLLRRADFFPSWTVVMHPRQPPHATGSPPQRRLDKDPERESYYPPRHDPAHPPPVANGTSVYTTCRVISLVHTDYDGKAVELLSRLANDTTAHSLPSPLRQQPDRSANDNGEGSWEDALEYRTLHCVTRMVAAALRRINTTIEAEMAYLRKPEHQYPSWEWHFGQLRLGEVATLMHLRTIVHGHLRTRHETRSLPKENIPGYAIRRDACPREALDPLFERFGTAPL